MRDVIVAGNWKMHTTPADAGELAATIAARTARARRHPGHLPAVRLPRRRPRRAGRADPDVAVGAQNVHHELAGAYTGEIAAPMLAGLATWVIVGHSERRRDAGETDELIGRKLGRAVDAGSAPILCVGEQLGRARGRRGRGASSQRQLAAALAGHDAARARGGRARHRLRAGLGDRDGPQRAAAPTRPRWPTRSATTLGASWAAEPRGRPSRSSTAAASPSANIGEFLAEPAIDGALVGGASLKPDEMAGIVARAGLTARAAPAPPA